MTKNQYNQACEAVGLATQGQQAECLGVSLRSAHGYANGGTIPEPVARLLRLMVRLKLTAKDVK